MRRAHRCCLVVTALMVLSGCCNEKVRAKPFWNRAMEPFFLRAHDALRTSDGITEKLILREWDGKDYVETPSTLRFSIFDQTALEVWFRNEESFPIRLDWGAIAYIDENGQAHETYSERFDNFDRVPEARGGAKPEVVQPGEGVWRLVRPVDKTYRVYFGTWCENSRLYSEPLIPWALRSFDGEIELTSHVSQLYDRSALVSWSIPVEMNGNSHRYVIRQALSSPEDEERRYAERLRFREEFGVDRPAWARTGPP